MNNSEKSRPITCFGSLLTIAVIALLGYAAAHMAVRYLYPMNYRDYIDACCEEYEVDRSLVYAIIHTESGFDPNARSEIGAAGLMQIMPETFSWLQEKLTPDQEPLGADALYDPYINIRYGVYYVSLLERQFGCDTLTIAAYHAGQGSVSKWLEEERVFVGCTSSDIPSSATGHYVNKVQRAREIYKKLYLSE